MSLLTRAQFGKTDAAKKPGASYGGYVNWVTKTRTKRAAVRVAAEKANPFGALMQRYQAAIPTPQQQIAQAHQAVNQEIQAGLAGYRASSKAEQQVAENQAKRAQGFATSLANLTATAPSSVANEYTQAADRIRAYGTGLTGELGQQFQGSADAAAQHLANQGANVGGTTVGSYDPASLRNTLQYTGVVLPGTTLEQQAAGAKGFAQTQRRAQTAQIGNIAQQYRQKKLDMQHELALRAQALQATRPDLYQKALAGLQAAGTQNMATLVSALALQGQQTGLIPGTQKPQPGFWTNPVTGTVDKIPPDYKVSPDGTHLVPLPKPKPTPKPVVTGLMPDGKKLLPGYWWAQGKGKGVPQTYDTKKFQLSPDGTKLIPLPGTTKTPAGTKPADIQKIIDKAATEAGKKVLGAPYSKPSLTGLGKPRPLLSYAAAQTQLLQAYFPKKYWKNPQVLAKIADLLSSAGYTKGSTVKPAGPTGPVKKIPTGTKPGGPAGPVG